MFVCKYKVFDLFSKNVLSAVIINDASAVIAVHFKYGLLRNDVCSNVRKNVECSWRLL